MKKIFFILFVIPFFFQTNLQAQTKDAFETQMNVYKMALKYFDLPVATNALYTAMALKPERKDLKDSLTLLYFAGERFGQANLLAEEILKESPKRKDLLEVVAVSKQSMGMVKESLSDYENLYKVEKQPFYLYQIATLQYQLKRFGECIASLDNLILDPSSVKQTVPIRQQNSQNQNVPIKAAALNVKGIIALELNKEVEAKDFFNKAIEAFPEFILAKNNLTLMAEKKEQTVGKPTSK